MSATQLIRVPGAKPFRVPMSRGVIDRGCGSIRIEISGQRLVTDQRVRALTRQLIRALGKVTR